MPLTRRQFFTTTPTHIVRFGMIYDMEKFFNIAGPCNPAEHYMLP